MKKTLLAAALIAGFAGVAQAETSVTLYGVLDGGIGYSKLEGTTNRFGTNTTNNLDRKRVGAIDSVQSGNRWGLKGSEDLGNGLRATFVLESGFSLATGYGGQPTGADARLFGRQATLGLAGDSWGKFELGRQSNLASQYFAPIDPFGTGFGQANIGAAFTAANTARYDNLVLYQSPSFSGFQFGVGYSFNINGSQSSDRDLRLLDVNGDPTGAAYNSKDQNQKAITTGLRYANGPINVALTYDQVKAGAAVEGGVITPDPITGVPFRLGGEFTDNVTIKSWNLGGTYDFEVAKAHLAFGQTRNGLLEANVYGGMTGAETPAFDGQRGLKVNSYMVGVSAPVGNGNLMASWTMADPRSQPDDTAGEGWDKQQTYSLGYTYSLSKRTNVYAIGSYAKHIHFLPDAKSTFAGVGVRHQF